MVEPTVPTTSRDRKKIVEMYKTWKRGGKDGVQKLLEKRQKEAAKQSEQFITGRKQ